MLSARQIDALAEHVLQRLLGEAGDVWQVAVELVDRMAGQFPDAAALTPVLVLTLAADGLDETLGEGRGGHGLARELWRAAALVSVDVLAMNAARPGACKLADLHDYRQTGDSLLQG